jgi:hypothetical protein
MSFLDSIRLLDRRYRQSNTRISLAKVRSNKRCWTVIIETPGQISTEMQKITAVVKPEESGLTILDSKTHPVLTELAEIYHAQLNKLYSPILSSQVIRLIKVNAGFHLSKQGGTYFVPYVAKDLVMEWKETVRKASGSVQVFGVSGNDLDKESLAYAFLDYLDSEVENLILLMKKNLKEQTVEKLKKHIRFLQSVLDTYDEIVRDYISLGDLRSRLSGAIEALSQRKS